MSLMLAAQAVHHAVAAVPFCTTSVACAGVLRCLLEDRTDKQCRQPCREALWGGKLRAMVLGTLHARQTGHSCAGTRNVLCMTTGPPEADEWVILWCLLAGSSATFAA